MRARQQSSRVLSFVSMSEARWAGGKVATGAAALLAIGMGYHVIFGQNGLTAYQQKRQDAQSLDHQLHSLQRENELLKGHVDRSAERSECD